MADCSGLASNRACSAPRPAFDCPGAPSAVVVVGEPSVVLEAPIPGTLASLLVINPATTDTTASNRAAIATLCAAIERSRRYGSPLADQLRRQATVLRRDQRRTVEERAARAAPKIQLVVALVLVPSVLLMIVAALVANADVLLRGF